MQVLKLMMDMHIIKVKLGMCLLRQPRERNIMGRFGQGRPPLSISWIPMLRSIGWRCWMSCIRKCLFLVCGWIWTNMPTSVMAHAKAQTHNPADTTTPKTFPTNRAKTKSNLTQYLSTQPTTTTSNNPTFTYSEVCYKPMQQTNSYLLKMKGHLL